MDILGLKRHLPSIEDGRWVDSTEVPGLLDIRVKVRGASAVAAREIFAAKERAVEPRHRDSQGRIKVDAMTRIMMEMIGEWILTDIEGATLGDKKLTAEDVAGLVLKPEFQPLADLIMQASSVVDGTREAQIEAVAKN